MRIQAIAGFVLCIAANLFAQAPASPWETVAPPGAAVYSDLKTAAKDAAVCYRVELSGTEFLLDKKYPLRVSQLGNAMALRLNNNNLTDIPPAFLGMHGLVYFRSSGNPLVHLSDSLGMLNQLRFLELYETNFDTVPEGLYGLTRLQSLTIAANKDTLHFGKGIAAFGSSLMELRISGTVLDTLPAEIASLNKLNRLVMYKCQLREFPPQVLPMNKLGELWLDSNNIAALPRDIYKLSSLTLLSLRGNRLTHIPSTICFMQGLELLDLRGNPIDPYEVKCLQALLPKCRILF